ncbi:MAG: EpsG family protein, partial [Bacteroidales bacterium]|nr:EpsG family protein [Bacteroidales bacterium]
LGFEERLSSYVNAGANVDEHMLKTGFRWDFLLYSSMPVLLGWYVIFRKRIYTRTYALLLGTYMYANAFWIMIIRAPYSNRFAYLSWFLYPIALAYPMLVMPVWKKAPGLIIGIIMLGHMAFSIFMLYMTGRY